jgi:DNA-binding NarL/FixJ family response regulator
VLIVEDDFIIASSLKDSLQELGYSVVGIVDNGPDAIKKAEEMRPDAVIMDIHLKGPMDGTQAAEMIWGVYNIPVIYLTAHTDDATLQQAQKAFPFGYIVKPFNDKVIKSTLKMALYRHQAEMERWKMKEDMRQQKD